MTNNQLNSSLIRKLYPIAHQLGAKLPKCLAKRHDSLIFSDELLAVIDTRNTGEQSINPLVVRSDSAIEASCSIYYFEVTIHAASSFECVSVGFCSVNASYSKWLGSDTQSFGYSNRNGILHKAGEAINLDAPTYSAGDVIGCGLNLVNKSVFFTKNGDFLGPLNIGNKLSTHRLYLAIALGGCSTSITVNFGQKQFKYDILGYIQRERATAIGLTIQRKCSDQLAYTGMKSLVASYLLHHGYLATAKTLLQSDQQQDMHTAMIEAGRKKAASMDAQPNGSTDAGHTNGSNSHHLMESAAKIMKKPDSLVTMNRTIRDISSKQTSVQSPMSNLATPDFEDGSVYSPLMGRQVSSVKSSAESWPEDDNQVALRIKLINTIMRGDFVQAILQLKANFDMLTKQQPQIVFSLEYMHFIQLVDSHHKSFLTTMSSSSFVNGHSNGFMANGASTDVSGFFADPLLEPPFDGPNNGHNLQQQKLDVPAKKKSTNGEDGQPPVGCSDEWLHLVEYGRYLRTEACHLRELGLISTTQLNLLRCAFTLIAYNNPLECPFSELFNRDHVENLCDNINSAILVHLNNPPVPVLELLLGALEQAVCGSGLGQNNNASQSTAMLTTRKTVSIRSPSRCSSYQPQTGASTPAYMSEPSGSTQQPHQAFLTVAAAPLFDPYTPITPVHRLDSSFYSLFQISPASPSCMLQQPRPTSSSLFFSQPNPLHAYLATAESLSDVRVPTTENLPSLIPATAPVSSLRSISLETRMTASGVSATAASGDYHYRYRMRPLDIVTPGEGDNSSSPPDLELRQQTRSGRRGHGHLGAEMAGFFHPSLFLMEQQLSDGSYEDDEDDDASEDEDEDLE